MTIEMIRAAIRRYNKGKDLADQVVLIDGCLAKEIIGYCVEMDAVSPGDDPFGASASMAIAMDDCEVNR